VRGRGTGEPGRVYSQPQTSLLIHVQTRAKHTDIVGMHGDAVRIRVAAPPVDGAANEELVRFLAESLRLPRSQIRLDSGAAGRRKRVAIVGLDHTAVLQALGMALRGPEARRFDA
jgi:uncharacterized protein (TIGR00251 family)